MNININSGKLYKLNMLCYNLDMKGVGIMSDKKEYLNEKWYQDVKKKICRISVIIFIVSILIGGSLITTGIIKNNSSKKEAAKIKEEKVAAVDKRLTEIASEKQTLNKEYTDKEQECASLSMDDSDWFSKSNKCNNEASTIKSKINDLEMEEFKLNNAHNTNFFEIEKDYSYLIIVGVFVIFIGGMVSLMFYIVSKKREIQAFTIQQSMPVTKEAIDKMSPSMGKAAKEIAKGVKDGIKEDK